MSSISIRGARLHNPKNVSLSIPRKKLVVFTGLSASDKSTIAFDALHKEGQRRYMESLGLVPFALSKPPVDSIAGLSPSISVGQRQVSQQLAARADPPGDAAANNQRVPPAQLLPVEDHEDDLIHQEMPARPRQRPGHAEFAGRPSWPHAGVQVLATATRPPAKPPDAGGFPPTARLAAEKRGSGTGSESSGTRAPPSPDRRKL
jgi:hypothetical protein